MKIQDKKTVLSAVIGQIKAKKVIKKVRFSTSISESVSKELKRIQVVEGLTQSEMLETLVRLYNHD